MSIFVVAQQLVDSGSLPHAQADQTTLSTILTDVFIVIGSLAIFIIVLSGLRYIFARGNPEKLSQVRNTILYATIGLIVSALAAAVVNVFLGRTA